MELATIQLILNILLSVAPMITSNSAVQSAIELIQKWLPLLIEEGSDLYKTAITVLGLLRGNKVLTADQVAQVDAIISDADAAFNAAAADFNKRAHPNG